MSNNLRKNTCIGKDLKNYFYTDYIRQESKILDYKINLIDKIILGNKIVESTPINKIYNQSLNLLMLKNDKISYLSPNKNSPFMKNKSLNSSYSYFKEKKSNLNPIKF